MQAIEKLVNYIYEWLTESLQGVIEAAQASAAIKETDAMVWEFVRDDAESEDMNVDASGGDETFNWTCPVGSTFELVRINMHLQDGSIRADGFGGLAALTDGLLLHHIDVDGSTILKDFADGLPIKRHNELGLLAGTDSDPDTSGVGGAQDAQLIRWTIANAGAKLRVHQSQSIRITVRDDLSNLTLFRAMVQGVYE